MRLVRAQKVELQEAALAVARAVPRRKGGGGKPIRVQRVQLRDVKLYHSVVRLADFDVDLQLGEHFRLEQGTLETRDGAMQLLVEPLGEKLTAVTLTARAWTLPAGAPLTFERRLAEGTLKGQQLELAKIEGKLYGGTVAGSANADWADKDWHIVGKAKLAGVELLGLERALAKPQQLSGRLKADAVFSTRAKKSGEFRSALDVDGAFEVIGGAYRGVDLSKAGDVTGKPTKGDATQFKELTGKVKVRGRRTQITELCVRSSSVVAGGHVEIAPDDSLSGKLDIAMAKTGGFVGVPVSVSGTTSDPYVLPTKGYLIGAAIGSILLPGIGTSIGSALGGRIGGVTDCK